MDNYNLIDSQSNINLSIQLINDISIYAKRVTVTTLHTTEVIMSSIASFPHASLGKDHKHSSLEKEYLNKITSLVERFGQKVDQAIATENSMIKRKEDLIQVKLLRKILKDWEPMSLMTNTWIGALYEWFKFRIDQISKTFLNQLIDQIQFMEVDNVQQ